MSPPDIEISDKKCHIKNMEIPATYYDRTGHFPLWNISKILQDTGYHIIRSGFMDNDIFPEEDGMTFVIREKTKIDPYVMQKMSSDQRLHYSTIIEFEATSNSTATFKMSVVLDESNGLLCERHVKSLYVNLETRRPIAFPSWFKDKYKTQNEGLQLQRVSILKQPTDCFQKDMEVRPSDCDRNGHANTSMYYKFMIDCATAASTSGYYRHFPLDMAWYPVREVDVSYLGECKANDIIVIFTWQEESNIEKSHFLMFVRKKCVFQGTVIFQATEFQDLPDSKL